MNVTPCGMQVLVKLDEVNEMSKGGIIQHTQNEIEREQNGKNMGRVIKIGPFVHADWEDMTNDTSSGKAKEWGYEVGDLVLFNRYDGVAHDLPNYENYRLIPSNCIIGKVEQ